MNPIRHITEATGSRDLFATAELARSVTVWSFKQRKKLSEFDTGLDFGGRRLGLIPSRRPLVIVGAYYRHGVSAYEPNSGGLVWQRKDARRVQAVRPIRWQQNSFAVAIGREAAPLLVIDSVSGEDLKVCRGVRYLYQSPHLPLALAQLRHRVRLVSLPDMKALWQRPSESFSVLDAASSPTGFLCSWAGGWLTCMNLSGETVWRWSPRHGEHCLRLSWNPDLDAWVAVIWPFIKGGTKTVTLVTPGGDATEAFQIGEVAEAEFLDHGRYLVCSDGVVRGIPSGEVVWKFQAAGR
jgi:hypothetical protein